MTHPHIRLAHSMGLHSGAWKGGKLRLRVLTVTINPTESNTDGKVILTDIVYRCALLDYRETLIIDLERRQLRKWKSGERNTNRI